MGIVERKQRQKEEVRTSIINAARQLALEEGWQALSIRKIADVIEYSVPVIYDHFENKEAIHFELTREGYRLLSKKLKEAKQTVSDPKGQIEIMAMAYWDFAFTNKEYYQLMYGVGMPTCDMIRTIPEMQAFSELINSSIQELIAGSKDPGVDVRLKSHSFSSMLHGLVSINMVGQSSANESLNILILKDLVSGFIKSITG